MPSSLVTSPKPAKGDVIDGLTPQQAGREIGSIVAVYSAIYREHLQAHRSGKGWVIPRAAWAAWKAMRNPPPDGYVRLSDLEERVAMARYALVEAARQGHIATAVRCHPFGAQRPSWYLSPQVVEKLVADHLAGRPMPWQGKPKPQQLKASFEQWQERRHPEGCETCAGVWGKEGAPKDFDEFTRRYHELPLGAKVHLGRPWIPGMTIDEAAAYAKRSRKQVDYAMNNGALPYSVWKGRKYASRAELWRWTQKNCPSGDDAISWISVATAPERYFLSRQDLRKLIASGKLRSKTGEDGLEYVLRVQCRVVRDKFGLTEDQGARFVGTTVPQLRGLLDGLEYRGSERIPMVTLRAIQKRLLARPGFDIEEAASILHTSVEWVQERIDDGTVRMSESAGGGRLYLPVHMFDRLRAAMSAPAAVAKNPREGLLGTGKAALEAGVDIDIVNRWGDAGEVKREEGSRGWWLYDVNSLRERARRFWTEALRAGAPSRREPPAWLVAENLSAQMHEQLIAEGAAPKRAGTEAKPPRLRVGIAP
jgi:hypothetical protein